ncbi:MAG: hypothetical protein HY596_00900 [Candidatus Omnitrophica bacterium]|nr:hypothetical protein [Candidatus Omnitrophota bacterium]
MRHAVVRWTVALALSAGALTQAVAAAEEAQRTLPTLLIKGEVVSVDASDPQAALLKVKDRYGFETPIYLSTNTKIAQGDQTLTAADLAAGRAVEVEYNFDINTAKRHAVNVAVSAPAATAAAIPAAAATTSEAPVAVAPVAPAAPMPTVAPAAATPEAAPASSAPAQPAASATSEQPASTTATQ